MIQSKIWYSSRTATINDELVHLAGCKAYENKPYPFLLTLYGHYSKKPVEKKGFHLSLYGINFLGKIMTYLMFFFLHLFDWSVPYYASLEAGNWVSAGQHLVASQPRSSIWLNQNVTIFLDNYFGKTLNCYSTSTIRAFDLIPKMRARPEYQLSSGIYW